MKPSKLMYVISLCALAAQFIGIVVYVGWLLYRDVTESEALEVQVVSPAVPTVVRIVGPRGLVDALKVSTAETDSDCSSRRRGPLAVFVDWGWEQEHQRTFVASEFRPGAPCPDPLQRTFNVPGTYEIKARYMVGSLPAGRPIASWNGSKSITIPGDPRRLEFALLSPKPGDTIPFGNAVKMQWSIVPDGPVDLTAALIDQDGEEVFSRTFRQISYTGHGRAELHPAPPAQWADYERRLLAGKDRFTVRTSLRRNGAVIATQQVEQLVGSSEILFERSLDLVSSRGKPANTAALWFRPLTPDCASISIDWGDGSKPDIMERPLRTRCALTRERSFLFEHTYREPGTYRIRARRNMDILRPLDEQSAYEELTAIIRASNRHTNVKQDACVALSGSSAVPRIEAAAVLGSSPLTVALVAPTRPVATYDIRWGDGTIGSIEPVATASPGEAETQPCGIPALTAQSHVYPATGVYTVHVSRTPAFVGQPTRSYTVNIDSKQPGNSRAD